MNNKTAITVFPSMHPICSTVWSILVLDLCVNQTKIQVPLSPQPDWPSFDELIPTTVPEETHNIRSKFIVEYQWQFVNYSWPSPTAYRSIFRKHLYIPANIIITGVKYYDGNVYVAMPQIRRGVPVTLGYFRENSNKHNPLINAYPNWETYFHRSCSTLQSVQNFEIDENGVMWVLDGVRINNNTKCPPKLVLLNLKTEKTLQSYDFPIDICSTNGGFLNDIVVEDAEFAYITDNSVIDPGLIVYSLQQNRAWKLRDRTMFGDLDASEFIVNKLQFSQVSPISGIALSPKSFGNRQIFFSTLADFNLYSIDLNVLKDENLVQSGDWRKEITLIGKKQSQSDGLIIDNLGNLYYGLLPLYSVGVWNIKDRFSKAKILDKNTREMHWIDCFSIDDDGNLRLLANNRHKFMDLYYSLQLTNEIRFRILKYAIGAKSYLE